MCPQAALPDLNTAFIVYRREAITSLKSKRYDACFGALYAINGLLPKEYRVKISTKLYDEKTNLDTIAVCQHCKEQTNYNEINIHDVLLPVAVGIITGLEYEKVWTCTKCNQVNKLYKTDILEPTIEEPYFVKIVPKPPMRRTGLLDRLSYHKQISRWVWTFLDELEAQMSNYRREYRPMNNDMIDLDSTINDSGEEIDN